MKSNHRVYSLPYNGTNPQWFLQEAEKRKKNIMEDLIPKEYRDRFNFKIKVVN